MNKTDSRLMIVIAETSPIISLGISASLKSLHGLQVNVVLAENTPHLEETLKRHHPDLLLANPAFCGGLNPDTLRNNTDSIKIMAIATTPLDKRTVALYDGAISIADDLDSIASKISQVCQPPVPDDVEKESLSTREKEVVALVVKGLTNKEIADRLYLSVHTVNTHRRNIARKLEIHSATGLTIYAIVNHLVEISDIKL